ncbi:MAG: M28 family metallopeptidase [Oscillospiraceae bacterium]|nr:M28 family metallopeptidase [Oscillospiraceae bacterium]
MPKTTMRPGGPNLAAKDATKTYMLDGIRHVCEHYKARLPGSQSERDAQDFFEQELQGYSDNVLKQDFTLHPAAFMGWLPIAMVFVFISVAIYFFNPGWMALTVLGAVLPAIALAMALFEFLFYRSFVDFLFPKKVSRNVYATRKPEGEVKRRIIFGGHTDVAHEWRLTYWGGAVLMGIGIGGGVAAVVATLVVGVINLVSGGSPAHWQGIWLVVSIALLVLMVPAVLMLILVNYKVACDGANDNLSANYIAMAVLKDMHDEDIRFANTEVACFLSGSEEAGLRGARAFAKMNYDMLADPNVETVFVALDTMREIEELRVCHKGCTGTVRNSKRVAKLIRKAGVACGVDIPNTELYPGAVDAEAFSRLGLEACGLTGVSHEAKRYYHTREDVADNVDIDCLTLSLNICKAAAEIFDKEGAK